MSAGTAAASRSRPTVPVEGGLAVIGAGFGRTGTSSLQEALEILGYGPCYHMREVFKDPTGLDKWDRIGRGEEKPDWDDVFFGYKSAVDLPASTYYKELMEHYPKAKVILTVRDEEEWWISVFDTIAPANRLWRYLYYITFLTNVKWQRMSFNTVWKPFCGGLSQARNKKTMIGAFRAHNKNVKAVVPRDKLLVMDIKEGWKPLCDFLNCTVPDVPFPRAWESAQFKIMIKRRKQKAIKRLIGAGIFFGAAGYLAFRRSR